MPSFVIANLQLEVLHCQKAKKVISHSTTVIKLVLLVINAPKARSNRARRFFCVTNELNLQNLFQVFRKIVVCKTLHCIQKTSKKSHFKKTTQIILHFRCDFLVCGKE